MLEQVSVSVLLVVKMSIRPWLLPLFCTCCIFAISVTFSLNDPRVFGCLSGCLFAEVWHCCTKATHWSALHLRLSAQSVFSAPHSLKSHPQTAWPTHCRIPEERLAWVKLMEGWEGKQKRAGLQRVTGSMAKEIGITYQQFQTEPSLISAPCWSMCFFGVLCCYSNGLGRRGPV